VKLLGADAFGPDPNDGAGAPSGPEDDRPYHYYGGSGGSHLLFWHAYPLGRVPPSPPGQGPVAPAAPPAGPASSPSPRRTPFSPGAAGPTVLRPPPSGFGTVLVAVSIATGALPGAKLLRSGSWNRSTGGWGG